MTLREMREMVRAHAEIEGHDEWSTLIDKTINQVLRRYTKLVKYSELFIPDWSIDLTAATSAVTLPTNLQHLDSKSIRYDQGATDGLYAYLHAYNRYSMQTEGTPVQWLRVGSTIRLNPYTDILATDNLIINYWKIPDTLLSNTATFPIVDLEDTVMFGTAAMLCTYGNEKKLQLLKQEERNAYNSVCALVNETNQ